MFSIRETAVLEQPVQRLMTPAGEAARRRDDMLYAINRLPITSIKRYHR